MSCTHTVKFLIVK